MHALATKEEIVSASPLLRAKSVLHVVPERLVCLETTLRAAQNAFASDELKSAARQIWSGVEFHHMMPLDKSP